MLASTPLCATSKKFLFAASVISNDKNVAFPEKVTGEMANFFMPDLIESESSSMYINMILQHCVAVPWKRFLCSSWIVVRATATVLCGQTYRTTPTRPRHTLVYPCDERSRTECCTWFTVLSDCERTVSLASALAYWNN